METRNKDVFNNISLFWVLQCQSLCTFSFCSRKCHDFVKWDACKQWDLQGLGLLMGSVAMLSLCLENTFIWKDHCCIGIIPFCIINNFIVMKKNSLEISMQSLTSHNQLIHCHKIVIVVVKSVSDWGYFL